MVKRIVKFFTAIAFLAALSSECAGGVNEMKIYAVRYGKSTFQNRFIFYGDKSGGSVPFSWMFYYIEFNDKRILIDTGFNDSKMIKMFAVSDFKDPVAILNDNGIEAESITDVIITHGHFDHIGNVHRFRNAKIIINNDELAELNKGNGLNEVKKFLSSSRNVTVFDDSFTLYNTFTVKKIGGHTKGSSVVYFKSGSGNYCFTGDEIYLYDNIQKNTGNGSALNHTNNLGFIESIIKGDYHLYIFHDNRYLGNKERFIKVFPHRQD